MTKSSSISHAFFLFARAPPCLCLLYISLLPLEFGSLLSSALCLGSSLLLVLLADSPLHLHLGSSQSSHSLLDNYSPDCLLSGALFNLPAIDESNVLSETLSLILNDYCL